MPFRPVPFGQYAQRFEYAEVRPSELAVPPAPMIAALDVAYEAMLRARVRTALAKKLAA